MIYYHAGSNGLTVGAVIEPRPGESAVPLTTDADQAWKAAGLSSEGCCHRGGVVYRVEPIGGVLEGPSAASVRITRAVSSAVPRARYSGNVVVTI